MLNVKLWRLKSFHGGKDLHSITVVLSFVFSIIIMPIRTAVPVHLHGNMFYGVLIYICKKIKQDYKSHIN